MPETPAPNAKAKPNLAKKAGPLPIWAWGLVIGGIAFVFIMLSRKPSGATNTQSGNPEINGALAGARNENGALGNSLDPSVLDTLLGQFTTQAGGAIQSLVQDAERQLAGHHATHAHGGAGGKRVPRGGSAAHGGATTQNGVGDSSGWPGPGSGYLPGGAINPFTGEYTEPQVGGKIVYIGGDSSNQVLVPWGPGTPLGFWQTVTDDQARQYGVAPGGALPWSPGHHFTQP